MENKETILKLYDELISPDLQNTTLYGELLSKFAELKEEFDNSISEEQKKQLDILEKLLDDMNEEENRQAFVEGFSLATQLLTQGLYRKNEEN